MRLTLKKYRFDAIMGKNKAHCLSRWSVCCIEHNKTGCTVFDMYWTAIEIDVSDTNFLIFGVHFRGRLSWDRLSWQSST